MNIPNTVTTIGEEAFYNWSGVTEITLGNGLCFIGKNAFKNTHALTDVYVNSTGWYVTEDSTATSGTFVDLSTSSVAATFLKDTYLQKYIKRNP